MTLQRLTKLSSQNGLSDHDISKALSSDSRHSTHSRSGLTWESEKTFEPPDNKPGPANQTHLRSLQSYRGDRSHERVAYMEKNSILTRKGLGVSIEQVSVFLCSDNTVVSFFEHSGDIIEEPILKRLNSPETILRRSNDASLLVHSIIDAITDLAIPIVTTYEKSIAELEMDVLTEPAIGHSKALYVVYLPLTISVLLTTKGTSSPPSFQCCGNKCSQSLPSSTPYATTTTRRSSCPARPRQQTPSPSPAEAHHPNPHHARKPNLQSQSHQPHTPTSATSRTTAS